MYKELKAGIATLGCKVNQYESQVMMDMLCSHGFEQVAEGQQADVFIVNSCTVTATGDKKVRQTVRRARRENPEAVIILTGCMPQAFPQECEAMEEADIIIGNSNRSASDYEACIEYCDKVIKAKKEAYEQKPSRPRWGGNNEKKSYYLSDYSDMYNDLFGETGQNADESIFELQYRISNVANTGLDQMYYRYKNGSSDGFGYLKASKKFGTVDATGNGVWNNNKDQRLFEFLYDAAKDGTEMFGIRKMVASRTAGTNNTAEANPSGNRSISMQRNWIFYRLTDVMLMKAEALVQLYNMGGKAEGDTRNEEAFNICKYVNDRALSDDNKASYALKYSTYRDKMEDLVLAERARELCFEGKRWFDLMRYNYRHTTTQADLTKMLSQEGYTIVNNSDEFFNLALRKYTVPSAMKVKMRDERYLYMPINQDEVEINTNLKQNPVYKSAAKY